MGRRGYPPEFRRRVLDLIDAGRKVADVARDLGISSQTIYNWRRQHRIDQGLEPGLSSGESAELLAARRRIAQLETELKIARRATELLKDVKPPKVRYAAIKVMAAEKLPVQGACRILEVSESGFYAWCIRPPSERSIRHAWLTDMVTEVHDASRQTYGSIRVHAELTLGRGVNVGRHQVELVMRRAGLTGVVGRRKRPRIERPTRLRWISSTARSVVSLGISCGSPTSPSIRHGREGSTAAWCSMSSRGVSWGGRSTRRQQQGSSPTLWAWPSTRATRSRES